MPESTLDDFIADLRQKLADPRYATADGLAAIMRQLARWRSGVILHELAGRHDSAVLGGPFKGMHFTSIGEGGAAARLMGTYEASLHSYVELVCRAGFESILNIGCSSGYYAVGFALRSPQSTVFAYDADASAREMCASIAAKNGVADRVKVGALFKGEDFAAFADRKTLAFVDIEGFEDDLLDPAAFPALAGISVIVECHDIYRSGVTRRLVDRFSPTHMIHGVKASIAATELPDWLAARSHLDQILATWEWRVGPTPWLVMQPKAAQAPVPERTETE